MLGVVDEILDGATANFKQNFARRLKQVGLVIYGWGSPEEVGSIDRRVSSTPTIHHFYFSKA